MSHVYILGLRYQRDPQACDIDHRLGVQQVSGL